MRQMFVPILAVVLTATACSSEGTGDEVASLAAGAEDEAAVAVTEEEVDREEALLAFTQCLREEGLEVEDPEVGPDGHLRLPRPENLEQADREALQAAREACSEHLDGVTIGFEERDSTDFEDMLLEYAACMRENGYDMPDPDLSGFQPGSGQGGGPFGGIEDRSDPAFSAADEACRSIFTEAGFGSGRGRGGG